MATKRVNADELNLRSTPRADGSSNVIAVLRKAQVVETTGAPNAAGWIEVAATVEGQQMSGFVAARLLRDPVAAAKERLIEAAVAEWFRFDKGKGAEHKAPYSKFVGEMWAAIGMDLDGKDRDVPWSAAFISWVVRQAGPAYSGFRFAAAHARYIHQAIKARFDQSAQLPFWGFPPNEHKVELGDLICQWRIDPVTYDKAKKTDAYFSHCDLVVEIDGAGVRAIGGNNSQTVGFKSYARNPAGFVKSENNVFAVLANRR